MALWQRDAAATHTISVSSFHHRSQDLGSDARQASVHQFLLCSVVICVGRRATAATRSSNLWTRTCPLSPADHMRKLGTSSTVGATYPFHISLLEPFSASLAQTCTTRLSRLTDCCSSLHSNTSNGSVHSQSSHYRPCDRDPAWTVQFKRIQCGVSGRVRLLFCMYLRPDIGVALSKNMAWFSWICPAGRLASPFSLLAVGVAV
ncbi:hypothetical protein BD310DRAFT_727132 [Dichomitus squalens]|uniref:Uncharacterized protein n=1 Tax=Dichomitus squalens TaxID=114155 RepID=A0A4Q9PL15_9APHY|nr:hypothetical protein BD310DRAFT_727132 [Dichomitus squalens]